MSNGVEMMMAKTLVLMPIVQPIDRPRPESMQSILLPMKIEFLTC
jgi:hypothetical protein